MPLGTIVDRLFPPECPLCRAETGVAFHLCPDCLRDTPMLTGPLCATCAAPVLVPDGAAGEGPLTCDDCLVLARPWRRGRAVFRYAASGRRIMLLLKHADRTDLARTLGPWLRRAAGPLLTPDTLVVPVPLHPRRLFRRRYNQAALLARAMGGPGTVAVDALRRLRATPALDHRGREERFALLDGVIAPAPDRRAALRGRDILLVDDVMTTGATLAAATEACLAAGAAGVDVLVCARVTKDEPEATGRRNPAPGIADAI